MVRAGDVSPDPRANGRSSRPYPNVEETEYRGRALSRLVNVSLSTYLLNGLRNLTRQSWVSRKTQTL